MAACSRTCRRSSTCAEEASLYLLLDAQNVVRLLEPDEFQSFKLVVRHPIDALPRVRDALNGVAGRIDEHHAWISQSWLRTESGVSRPAAWQEKFAGLVVYAGNKGWLDADSGDVRAHIDWQPG